MKIRSKGTSQVVIENKTIQGVDKFVYQVCEVRMDGDIRNGVGIRIGKADATLRNME